MNDKKLILTDTGTGHRIQWWGSSRSADLYAVFSASGNLIMKNIHGQPQAEGCLKQYCNKGTINATQICKK